MEYTASNILWIKNVKRNHGNDWAYADVHNGNTFWLNWPTAKRGSATTPNIGDIIVLFQKPNVINGKRNNSVHLTHLVSPISDKIHEDFNSFNHKWCREVQLISIANPLCSIPNPGYFNFFKPNRGLTNPIENLDNTIGLTNNETREMIWALFQDKIPVSYPDNNIIIDNNYSSPEGLKIKKHVSIEFAYRNSKIVKLAKQIALRKGNGHILCECCRFDFFHFYGNHGYSFIECHHKKSISEGERITSLNDLALVCPNCHRMLHRKNLKNKYYTIEELKTIIDKCNVRLL